MVRVAIKNPAEIDNPAVGELVEEQGTTLTLHSLEAAEGLASELSECGEPVRIQRAAPQDPADVDYYLIRWPDRHTQSPKSSRKQGLTFDVSANQYGAIGQSLVVGSYGLSPAVKHYVYEEIDGIDERTHRLTGRAEPYLPEDVASDVSWSPDCLVRACRRGTGKLEEMIFGEVKTGDASFERSQRADMQTVADSHRVLKIRVDIDDLPEEYTVRIEQVKPG